MNRRLKIVVLTVLILPLIIILGAIAAVYYNQEKLVQQGIVKVNESFEGELEISGSHISPFANFPYISIDLENVAFYENKAKDLNPLYSARDVYIGFDLWDILSGNYKVKSIKINNGHLDIIKYENGDINVLLAKGIQGSEESEEDNEISFELQSLIINGFELEYHDMGSGQEILAHIQQLESKINLNQNHFFIDLLSQLELEILENGNPNYFSNKHFNLNLELDYDKGIDLLKIIPSKLKLEEAMFAVEGQIDFANDMDVDMKFYGEKPDFNLFAAFAPKEVGEALKRYKNEGQIYFTGSIRGKSANDNTPAIAVEFGVDKAYFHNIEQDKRVDELAFAGFFTNGKERSLESSELRLQKFRAKPAEGIFEGRMVIRNFKDPNIKVNIHADLDLEFVGQFLQIEGLERIKGQILLNMDFDELVDLELPGENLAQLKKGIDSELTLKNLSFYIPGYPHPVSNANGHAIMENGRITMDNLSFRIADSDFRFTMGLSDFPAVFHGFKKPVELTLVAKSNKINFPNLLSHDPNPITDEVIEDFNIELSFQSDAYDLWHFEHLPKGEFFIRDFFAKLKNYPHIFHDFHADMIITENEFMLKDFSGEIDESDFQFSGVLSNYPKWFQEVKTGDTKFEFDFSSRYLKLENLLSYDGQNYLPEDYRHEEVNDLKAKGVLDLHYDSTFKSLDLYLLNLEGKMKIHPLKLQAVNGRIHYEDEHVLLEKFEGQLGKSDFSLNMDYYLGEDISVKKRDNYFALQSQTLDLDALMNYEQNSKKDTAHEDAFNIFDLPFTDMRFSADIGKMNYHALWLEEFALKGRIQTDHYLYLDTLGMKVADGSLGMKGYFNGSDPKRIYFNSTMKANKLDLDKLLIKFENFGQDHFVNDNIHGKVSGTITSNFLVHPDFTPIIEKSEAQMDLKIYEGSIVNFAPLQSLSDYFKDKNLNLVRFDTLENTMDLKDGVLLIPRMNINSTLGFIEISGRQSLDLSMDYFIRVPLGLVTQVGFRSLFGGKNKHEVDPDQEDDIIYRDADKRVRFVNINMKGTPDDMKVSLGKDKSIRN